ncbi:MAG: hypothetical protein ACFFD6_09745, partial [Candidatus Thorarchaeota archaeon]
ILVKNHSLNDATFVFYAAVRPMSVRGIEPIETIEFHKTKCRLYTNDALVLNVDKPPDSVVMSTADNPNLIETIMTQTDRDDNEFSATKGLATAVLRFDIKLAPAASKRFFFMSPLNSISKADEAPVFPAKTSARDKNVSHWYEFVENTASFAFPDRELDSIVTQAKATLAVMAKSAFYGKTSSEYNWREKARVLLALSRIGSSTLAKEISLSVGKTTSIPEHADQAVLGPYLWGILQYNAHTKDLGFLRSIVPFINDVATMLIDSAELQLAVPELRPHSPPPSEPPIEIIEDENLLGVNDIIDATREVLGEPPEPEAKKELEFSPWTLSDLVEAVWARGALLSVSAVYDALGEEERYDSLIDVLSRYESLVVKNAERLAGEAGAFESPEGRMEALDLLDVTVLLDWQSAPPALIETATAAINDMLLKNLVKMPDNTALISSHLALRLAHYRALKRDDYTVSQALERVKELVSEFYTLPEYVNARTSGGSAGDGCSLMAAVDLLLLIREMIAFEYGEDLVVLPAISDEWYTSSTPLTVKSLPTLHGTVNIEVGVSVNQHQIEVQMKDLPRELIVHVPVHFSLPMMKAFGGGIIDRVKDSESPFIRIMPLSNNVVATFHR